MHTTARPPSETTREALETLPNDALEAMAETLRCQCVEALRGNLSAKKANLLVYARDCAQLAQDSLRTYNKCIRILQERRMVDAPEMLAEILHDDKE